MFEKLLIFLRLKKRKPLTEEQRQFVTQITGDALKELEKALCNYEGKYLDPAIKVLCDRESKRLDLSLNFLTDNATNTAKTHES
jgi:hypothetical protein